MSGYNRDLNGATNATVTASITMSIGASAPAAGVGLLLEMAWNGTGTFDSMSDARGNTWTKRKHDATVGGTLQAVDQWTTNQDVATLQAGDLLTFNFTIGTTNIRLIQLRELAGSVTLDLSAVNHTSVAATTGTSGTTGTTTQAVELVWASYVTGTTEASWTGDGAYTLPTANLRSSAGRALLSQYRDTTTTGAQVATFSALATTANYASVICTYIVTLARPPRSIVVHGNRRTARVRTQANRAVVTRAPSVTTATPLVRPDKIHVTKQALTRRSRVTRLLENRPTILRAPQTPYARPKIRLPAEAIKRKTRVLRLRAHRALTLRAPSTPTATPLVRSDRTHVTRQALTRRARVFRLRAHKPILLRPSRTPLVAQLAHQPIVRMDRRPSRIRTLANRALQLRAPSLTTPTPLVRPDRTHTSREALRRRARVTRAQENKPVVVRGAPLAPYLRPKIRLPDEAITRKARVWRLRAHKPTLLRPSRTAPAAAQPARQPVVRMDRRPSRLRTLANRALTLRATSTAPVAAPARQPLVSRRRRTPVARLLANRPAVLKAPGLIPFFRPKVRVPDEATNRKARVVRLRHKQAVRVAPRVAPLLAQPARQPAGHGTRRSRVMRALANRPLIIRARPTTPGVLVRNRVRLPDETINRKARTLRAHAHRPLVLRSLLRVAYQAVTGYYETSPAGAVTDSPTEAGYGTVPVGSADSSPVEGAFATSPSGQPTG